MPRTPTLPIQGLVSPSCFGTGMDVRGGPNSVTESTAASPLLSKKSSSRSGYGSTKAEVTQRMNVHHLNCGILHAPPNPQAACHCLLLEHDGRLALIDTGIGLHDIARPLERIGQPAIDAAGFQFH